MLSCLQCHSHVEVYGFSLISGFLNSVSHKVSTKAIPKNVAIIMALNKMFDWFNVEERLHENIHDEENKKKCGFAKLLQSVPNSLCEVESSLQCSQGV